MRAAPQNANAAWWFEFGRVAQGRDRLHPAQDIDPLDRRAARDGKWKFYLNYDGTSEQLYDLRADISESNNVYDDHPEIVARLNQLADKAREDLGDGERKGSEM